MLLVVLVMTPNDTLTVEASIQVHVDTDALVKVNRTLHAQVVVVMPA